MLTCRDFEKHLLNYVEGELEFILRNEADEHLVICRHCNTLLKDYQKVIMLAAKLKNKKIPLTVSSSLRMALSDKLGIDIPSKNRSVEPL